MSGGAGPKLLLLSSNTCTGYIRCAPIRESCAGERGCVVIPQALALVAQLLQIIDFEVDKNPFLQWLHVQSFWLVLHIGQHDFSEADTNFMSHPGHITVA